MHKGLLASADIIAVDGLGRALRPGTRPSAETALHCQLYERFPDVGAVVHGIRWRRRCCPWPRPGPALCFAGYEVLKAFEAQTTHDVALDLPLVDNDQDVPRMARAVAPLLPAMRLGYLIRAMAPMCGVETWTQPWPASKGWSSCWPVNWNEGKLPR